MSLLEIDRLTLDIHKTPILRDVSLAIAPGETQRWRIVNASVFTFLDLALEGHLLHQIASDGNPLRALRSVAAQRGHGRPARP